MAADRDASAIEMAELQPDSRRELAPNATENQHQGEPLKHSHDSQTKYLRARFDEKKNVQESLSPDHSERVKHELVRVKGIRNRFATGEKKKLIESLSKHLKDWRVCVDKNRNGLVDEIKKRRVLERKIGEKDLDWERRGGYTAKRYEDESKFLKTLKVDLPRGTETTNQAAATDGQLIEEDSGSGQHGISEPFYGLKACAMYFKMEQGDEPTAITRYYDERPQELDDRHHIYSQDGRKTEKLLSREFWRGQMHGSSTYSSNSKPQRGEAEKPMMELPRKGGPIHARHMRSKCSIIPRDGSTSGSPNDKNVALFLPYMHWETSSRRAKMVQVINEAIDRPKPESSTPTLASTVEEVTKRKKEEEVTKRQKTEEVTKRRMTSEPTEWRHHLANYLLTLAQVAEQIDYDADERLLRKYVTEDPPLHIRRTLDQYYFVTLDDTSQRDKDQVVYRGTLDKKWNISQSRVVMVDQLWLWILDGNTIITSFPRRWGRNKPDPSGVHKSLRERFEARPVEIRSIQHLALMIIDQCSRVFFDRTRPRDQRPEVMDLFASAIAHVDEMTAVAYDTFWHHTSLNNLNLLPKAVGDRYLNINPEGALLKEAQDIAEELKMMKRIYNDQLKVLQDFIRHLAHPQGRQAENTNDVGEIRRLLEDLLDSRENRKQGKKEESGAETPEGKQICATDQIANETLHEAEGVLELVKSRREEIIELEQSALHTCQQLQGFLTLKQQQASIVEAKAALRRAEESVKQGRAIMAFTIVTIFF
ncbi:uncharacterized protein PG998_012768, partial [Apiospora kogelbergensis]|uniref:uncharacterized protein n=1 Tax=Apiospora kogelbergensis TaxID=1337665 RepID=UPI00312F5B49